MPENFLLFSTLALVIKVSKNDHFSQKRYFYQKLSRKNVSSFPKSYFDINQTCQIVLTQNRYFWNFNATGLLYLSIKVWRKALKL